MQEEGYSVIFYVMLIIGIVGVVGFLIVGAVGFLIVGAGAAGDVTPLCLFLMLAAFAASIVATTVLWAACTVSGAHADAETPIDE